jgi:hypothetical protein
MENQITLTLVQPELHRSRDVATLEEILWQSYSAVFIGLGFRHNPFTSVDFNLRIEINPPRNSPRLAELF